MKIVLASSSPRRKDLMKEISSDFVIDVSNVDESVDPKLSPVEAVKTIALRKGEAVRIRHLDNIVISADTIVVIDNKIIGKPVDENDAVRILKLLSGRTHLVYTAYCLFYKDKLIEEVVESKVTFYELSDELIKDYVASKSPLDKAGAYGVQDNDHFLIVKEIKGSVSNVIGFPVDEIKQSLDSLVK